MNEEQFQKFLDYNFKPNLRHFRVEAGYSLDQFAEEHGISAEYLAAMEQGAVKAPTRLYVCLCNTLKIDLFDLIKA